MSTSAAALLKDHATSVLGVQELGCNGQQVACGGVVGHAGNIAVGRQGRKGKRVISEKSAAMIAAYPDCQDMHKPSKKAKARVAAAHAVFAAMPRCKCGLLLPCGDCLPTDAVTFSEQRMYREGGGR